jgi:hypothetical protein
MKKLAFFAYIPCLFTISLLLSSCSKEDDYLESKNLTELESRSFFKVGFGYDFAWIGKKEFRLTSAGISKYQKLEKEFGKRSSRVKSQMVITDFEYSVMKALRDNPNICPTNTFNNQGYFWKKYSDNWCFKPQQWCPDYTLATNYK